MSLITVEFYDLYAEEDVAIVYLPGVPRVGERVVQRSGQGWTVMRVDWHIDRPMVRVGVQKERV